MQPDVFFLLLIIGVLGLYTEFTHPGVVAPGVVGGICMVLALYAMQLLPVNLAGLLLIGLAVVLFVLEAKLASHGVLLVGGIVSMLLGATFLMRSPLTPGGVSIGVALVATHSVRLVFRFSDAAGPQIAKMENQHGKGRTAGRTGSGHDGRAGRGRGNDPDSRRIVARQFQGRNTELERQCGSCASMGCGWKSNPRWAAFRARCKRVGWD